MNKSLIPLAKPILILAPMAGVTDFPFRQIIIKYGQPSLVVSEMIASASMVRSIAKTMRRHCQPQENIAVQIVGNDPDIMAEATRISIDRGAKFIDINMGCPALKIAVNSYAGAALMKNEKLAQKIFESVVKASCVPVTVKMRKGWDNSCENAQQLCHIAYNCGIAWVSLHGRTRAQLFQGTVDWPFIHKTAQSVPLPVIGNGDIVDEMCAKTAIEKVSGLMIGRGNYGRPWFLKQVRHFLETGHKLPPPSCSVQENIVQEHFEAMLTYYGHTQGIMMARKHLAWYSKGYPCASEFRKNVFQMQEAHLIQQAIKDFYQNPPNAPSDPQTTQNDLTD
jgi:tRNA-dihydrouridine synthase B